MIVNLRVKMEKALLKIETHLLTAHERAIFLRLSGMGELVAEMNLDCTPSEFGRELKRDCEKGRRGSDPDAVKKYGALL